MCIVGVPTLKVIQAARTKTFFWQKSLDSNVEGPTRCARFRLERKEEISNTDSHSGGWNEKMF